ncbi:hypothetical protein [Streptomyces sp. HB132]|uniref:hypothetical protein n=1 Tax=Streptomyces sp. HB132 TaxID=767388 RepID=UPI00195F60C8|nr:hypothetical protein [Streptomyces sp. HB132]MBM7442418.1 hypothetical protein [Streptomyces sp. HB132]
MAAAVAVVHLAGVLPAQIHWAEAAGSPSSWEALRMATVSPVWRFNEQTGVAGFLLEGLWLALFLAVLLSATRALAARMGPPLRPGARQAVILLLAAPAAAGVALLISRFPDFLHDQEPDGLWQRIMRYEGPQLPRLLEDACTIAPHALLLGTAAAVTWQACAVPARMRSAGIPRSVRRRALFLVSVLRGPLRTLWPRIGETVLATAAATAFERLLALPALGTPARVAFEGLCPSNCGDGVASAVLPLPDTGGQPTTVQELIMVVHIEPLGHVWFTCAFAVTFFVFRALPAFRARPLRPATLFVLFWLSYAAGRLCRHLYVTVWSFGMEAPPVPAEVLRSLLLEPEPLRDALFSAPATAASATAVVALIAVVHRRSVPRRPAPIPEHPAD